MIWGAHEVDGRIAARAAVKLRAALRQSIDAKRLYQLYKESDPLVTDNEAQDNARARAWAMINMLPNNQALINALMYLWAEAFVLGEDSATEAIRVARELKKAPQEGVDWANWKPGDRASALLITPPKAFQSLLSRSGVAIRGLDKTGYDRVGTALARSIRLGLGDTNAAKLINDAIGDPARALTIAITETNRAVSLGAMKTYREAGLEKMEWATSDPCPECAQNNGQVVEIGGTFNSGAQQPPAHPNCRCALLPVIPDYETNEHGVVDVAPPSRPIPEAIVFGDVKTQAAMNRLTERMNEQRNLGFTPASEGVTREMTLAFDYYVVNGYKPINDYLRSINQPAVLRDRGEREARYLSKLIDQAPTVKKAFTAYRGVRNDIAETFLSLKPGEEIMDKGFLSISYNKATAENFVYGSKTNVVFEIVVPEGTKGLDVTGFRKEVKADAFFSYEYEYIAQAGSKLEILEVDKENRRIKAVLRQNG